MVNFSQNIQNFQRYGDYTYQFDNVGNMTFNSSSGNFNQVYVAFPLQNAIYDTSKIETLYPVEFEEFVPQVAEPTSTEIAIDEMQQQLDVLQEENVALKSQLDQVIAQTDTGTEADQMAVKQVILELRKTIGQGRVESDFSEDFPYTPIRKPTT